ncbi:cation:proton antiporter [Glycocaulis profundi]|nr:cation:proton antiporter [Glycocaulis profundi]
MSVDLSALPVWAAIAGSVFLVLGAGLTLIGALGLARLPSFYTRLHAPTLATSWGAGGMVTGSMIIFTAAAARPVLHEILIGIFITTTTPITLMMLGRAAVYRDRSEGDARVPPALGVQEREDVQLAMPPTSEPEKT